MNKKLLAKLFRVPEPPNKRQTFFKKSSFLITLIGAIMLMAAIVLSSLNDARKPAIYLYPTTDMNIKVKVDVNGFMYKDIPAYGKGWDVFTTKEGLIENKYDYLFYEALLFRLVLPAEGWVVEYSNLETWFNEKLPELGLNEKESAQFMEYWLEELPVANYYEIKLLDETFLTKNMTLSISPEPDTMIRLIFNFRPLLEKETINEPFISTPIRNGFTVVEWGGLLDK